MTLVEDAVAAPPAVLEVSDVAVHFGGVKAVDGISLALAPGKIFGILGPNGSGKSTLLAAITRLVPLTRGELLFDGQSYSTDPPHALSGKGVARTFQTVRLLQGRTVRENVALGTDIAARADRKQRAVIAQRIDEAIERTGLKGLEKLRPDELSYGYQRRVEIARAIAMNPRLLLLDEPTAGMNRRERDEVSELLKALRSEGLTQLLIEHDVQMMVETCDYLYAMNFGVMLTQGDPTAVVQNSAVQQAYLGKRGSKNA